MAYIVRAFLVGLFTGFISAPIAFPQSLSGVPSPVIRTNDRQAEWRIGFDPGNDGAQSRTSSRLHYQHGFGSRLRVRGIVVGSNSGPGGFDLTQTQVQTLFQYADAADGGINAAFRFDYLLSNGNDNPDDVRFGWTGDWPLAPKWTFRTSAFASVEVGNNRNDGAFLETRAALIRRFRGGHSFHLQSFQLYGFTSDLPGFNGQNHALGPSVSLKLSDRWRATTSAIFGISDAATDTTIRLFLGYQF